MKVMAFIYLFVGGGGLTKVSVFSFISFDHFSNEKKIDCCNTFLCCLIAENWGGGRRGWL